MIVRGCLTIDDPEQGGSEPGAWARELLHSPKFRSEAGASVSQGPVTDHTAGTGSTHNLLHGGEDA